jgi:hypothetical protein
MFKVKENKKLAKVITAAFALNTIGYTVVPAVMVSAAETQTDAEKKKAEEAAANKAAVQAAESYKAAVDSAAASTITLNDDDDDLQFLNKVISLCTQTNSKKTVADTYKELVAGAKDAQEKAVRKRYRFVLLPCEYRYDRQEMGRKVHYGVLSER